MFSALAFSRRYESKPYSTCNGLTFSGVGRAISPGLSPSSLQIDKWMLK